VKLVRRRKKAMAWMEHVAASNTILIRTMNVLRGLARAAGLVNSSMASLVMARANACPIIASMGTVAATFAICRVWRVLRRKREVAAMVFAAISPSIPIPTMNAL
jgi:hypothetical protein